ncbi:hypothetical protein Lqui_1544 [Legionella quinlivanii]|uniref:Uncharacterized protein n=1 Tax=Legionella quinlivanii TaxID=45073 RepID=A0A0W0XZQ6_9GAMM|nr:hypothetical protein [Legionella quinlivanii]KTD50219.1 hypothetical protein Lqui_1544 [Legionella quinlivanii]MCW8450036.1 hypothetical protein [Legionella quinlivanii]SEF47071.1 hypothetical protein SAMN02746093_00293 [Legionella quinlivanii DSM 21216]STY11817.1 Uncharacterised protein [Legionella quinlivanii]
MNEVDILKMFYDEMVARGVTREQVFLDLEEEAASRLSDKLGTPVSVEAMQKLADACIANEWLERTTIDPGYKFLSLTAAGLQIVLNNEYI